jgi:hypothetical protein
MTTAISGMDIPIAQNRLCDVTKRNQSPFSNCILAPFVQSPCVLAEAQFIPAGALSGLLWNYQTCARRTAAR